MISNLVRFAFVATRARGMFAGFLKAEDYQHLLKATDLAGLEKVLRKILPAHGPSHSAAGAKERAEHRVHDPSGIEDSGMSHFLSLARSITGSLPQREADFIRALIMEYEVYNIKALLRGHIVGRDTHAIRRELIPLGGFAHFDWEELLAEDEMPEILWILRTHPLGQRVEKVYMQHYVAGHDTYRLDARIDMEYRMWLFDAIGALAPEERPTLKRLIGQRIDAMNVSWILRFKEHFKMAPEEIIVELVPRGYQLDVSALRELVFAEDPKLLLALLRRYPWRSFIAAERLDIPMVEGGLERYIKEDTYKAFRRSGISFGAVVAFVLLAQAMEQDIVKILEGNEYGLGRQTVEPKLFYLNARNV